jgi:ATP-binding cassette subfamily C protein
MNIAMGFTGIIMPIIYGKFIDNVVYEKSIDSLIIYIIIFLSINLFSIVITYLLSQIRVNIEAKSGFALCTNVLRHLHKISLLDLENENSSYLSQRIKNDARDIISFCLGIIASVILNIVSLSISFAYTIKIDYRISILILIIAMLYIVAYKIFKKPLYKASVELRENQSRYFANINNQISHAKFIKSHSVEEVFFSILNKSFSVLYKKLVNSQKLTNLYNASIMFLSIAIKLVLFIFGGINILNGKMTIGTFFILSSYLDKAVGSLMFFASLGESYQVNLASYNRIKELLDKPCVISEGADLNDINRIDIENINFKYNEKLIINDFSYSFNKGNIYWIKGNNGAGKSTIISLILGLYEDKYEGNILYDCKDIRFLDMSSIRKNLIGVVEQNPTLIEDTIINNVTFSLNYDVDALNKYIKLVGLENFIHSEEGKLNQVINENSTNISGGEKQKLSIIRELIKNPSLLIFDEPTSSMDKDSKVEFYKYIKELKTGRIVIVISHDNEINEIADYMINMNPEIDKNLNYT